MNESASLLSVVIQAQPIAYFIHNQGRSQDFSKGGLKLWKQKPWNGKIACD